MKTQYVRSPQRGEVPRPQSLWRGLVTTIVLMAALAASFGGVTRAANPPVVQKYYIPFPENDLLASFMYLWGERPKTDYYLQWYPSDPMTTIVTITAPASGTIIYYDHWEDGYESDMTNPQQSTTQIWGDGNPANGSPPGVPSDVIPGGQVITLDNQLDSTNLQAVIDFDARDKIGSSKAIAVTRTGWASKSNTLWAGAVEVFHTGMWGTDYRSPVGESPSIPQTAHDDQFDFVGFIISAGEGGATVKIDKDNNGLFETTVTLAEGQSHFEHGGIVEAGPHSGVQLGGHITSNNPVQVVLLTGDYGGFFETRDSSLLPTTSWTSSYYTPVSTPDSVTWLVQNRNTSYNPRTVVWLYNPNASSITVTREYRNASGTLQTGTTTITAGSYARIVLDTSSSSTTSNNTGWHFYTTGSGGNPAPVFYGWSATDAATNQPHTNGGDSDDGDQVNQGWDWSFSLMPEVWLSPQVICGLGIGRDPTSSTSLSENGNPVWIATVGNGETARTVYVDYNGNGVWDGYGTDPGLDPNGFGYDISYSLKELEQLKIYDPDGDQTGMLVYVLAEGVKLVAAWGQDPVNYVSGDDTDNKLGSSPGAPGLDVGTSVPPLPIADAAKTAAVAVDTDGDGQASPSDTLEYDIRVVNTYRGNLQGPFVVQDALPADTTYVAGSTQYRYSTGGGTAWGAWIPLSDGGTFPFAGSGLSIPGMLLSNAPEVYGLPPREQIQIVFRARIDDYEALDPDRTAIVNTGSVGFTPYGFVIPLNANTPLKGSIGDRVWNDADNDQVQDAGEVGLNGVRVYADLDNDGVYDAGEPSDVTSGDGDYLITNLPAGSYTVRVDTSTLPAGYGPTYDLDGIATPNVASPVALAAGEDRDDVDFGYRAGASLGDRVWLDRDGDRAQEGGEPGINGVPVYIDLNNNDLYDAGEPSEITAGDGNYTIGGLAAGTPYNVRVDLTTLPGGLTQTHDLNGALDHEAAATLAPNEDKTDVDFGYRGAYSLGDRVWNDADGDGVQDAGEQGITGVVVFIDLDGDGVRDDNEPSATTGTNGAYTIGGLPPGTYTVRVDPASLGTSGYAPTYDLDGIATPHVAVATIINANLNTVDFGYRDRASLGDRVWSDANNNGQQDGGEVGINGVRVYIDSNGNNIYDVGEPNATTSGDGNYTIGNLAGGTTYFVRVDTTTLPGGASQTFDITTPTNDHEASVPLSASQDRTDVDFGYNLPATASLGDRVWRDDDGDGVQDAGEPGINGVVVYIDSDGDGIRDANEPNATTSGDGNYTIGSLTAGSYVVRVDTSTLPAGSVQTYDLNGALDHRADITLQTGQARTDVDFGYKNPATIGNQVWEDTNNNGLLDTGETGINGVQVQLFQEGKVPGTDPAYATTTTATVGADQGVYTFANVPPGNYFVYIPTPPASAPLSSTVTDTADNQEDNDDNGTQSASGAPVTSPVIALGAGETDLTIDFGFVPNSSLGTIGDFVWSDKDGDGVQDGGTDEPGLAGVTVNLRLASDNSLVKTTTTADGSGSDPLGFYQFADLPPNVGYYVEFVLKDTYSFSPPSQGAPATDSNANEAGNHGPGTTATVTLSPGENNRTIDAGMKRQPTAAELSYFRAEPNGEGGVLLTWSTLVEADMLGFRVERSNAASAWTPVSDSIIAVQGQNGQPQSYQLTDLAGLTTGTYRLVSIDVRGSRRVLAEFALGTRPTLRAVLAAGGLRLEIKGQANRTVVLESCVDAARGTWTTVEAIELDAAGAATVNRGLQGAESVQFFRIRE
ncbi:MAG TPA: SdrD B-like domain-containing protein [Candidatus Paceibacterota bacterium]|nr:SdrD B-like domain-containing protein [Candidatus Paceibacterota bacterium]